ncbi:MAG: formate dehydrogenase subunit delta [Colwellia sp.]|nr:formate dehydrogenase subunit delta [Colwellia sp.]MCW9080523.1 formate dehydrogenase subunit delta [Colwellia sp.]
MDVKEASIIKMSNQIADNIGLHLPPEQAVLKVVEHIQLFWAASMKDTLIAYSKKEANQLNNIAQLASIQLDTMRMTDPA